MAAERLKVTGRDVTQELYNVLLFGCNRGLQDWVFGVFGLHELVK